MMDIGTNLEGLHYKDDKVMDEQLSQICDVCRKMLDQIDDPNLEKDRLDNSTIPYHESSLALRQSAADGCALCVQFDRSRYDLDTSSDSEGSEEVELGDKESEADERSEASKGWIKICDPDKPGDDPRELRSYTMAFNHYENYRSVRMYPSRGPPVRSKYTGNTIDSLPQCKWWLERCISMHESCKLKSQPSTPTRLLYLGHETVRLLVSSDLPNRAKYATLSHCWGTFAFVTLKKNNIDSFRKAIPDNALTKTFLDAIYIARFLGIEYLWIDSLCIIQDDKDDWAHESSLMGSVYGGSVVTIAAAAALDGRSGCFRERQETWRCRARLRPHPRVDSEITYDCSCIDIKSDAHRVSPLCSRGWTLQEQILSPRTLSFNETEVYWECHEHIACESLPFGTGPYDINDPWQSGHLSRIRALDYSWTTVIEEYSKRKLTKNSDKLVAISSLARLEHQKTNDMYVAGLWRKDLEKQLCWSCFPARERISPYVAPSWSWASCDTGTSGIMPYYEHSKSKEKLVEVLDVDITLGSSDPFGAVVAGRLVLSSKHFFHARTAGVDEDGFSMLDTGYSILKDPICSFDLKQDRKTVATKSLELRILPVLLQSSSYYICLMLVRAAQDEKQYQRIGHCSIPVGELNAWILKYEEGHLNLLLEASDDEIVTDENGEKRHIIEIV